MGIWGLPHHLQRSGDHKRCAGRAQEYRAASPHLPLTKLAYHSTIGEKPDWSDEKPQAAFPSPSPGTSWAKHHRAVLSDHSSNFWYGSCWGTAIGTCIVLFLQNDNSSATTVKSSPLQKRLSAHTPKADLNQTKHREAKLLTGLGEVLQMQWHSNTVCSQLNSKGYSLYRRQVSLIPVEIPFPKGTSTSPRVVVAVGSGAVLPKPRKEKQH